MAVLGMRSVTLLADNEQAGLVAGDTVMAECTLGTDAYQPCAEVKVNGERVGLGRMDRSPSPWRFTDDAEQATYAHHFYE